ncbi:MAG: pre-peptidase C-terminal domain-containing protein, partial [Gemmatimonadaceae bacterium]
VHSVSVSPRRETLDTGTAGAFDAQVGMTTFDTSRRAWPPQLPDRILTDPYDPRPDMGITAFLRANPTFDGRGVTLSLADGSPDMFMSEMQAARTLDGKLAPKFSGYETSIDPDEEDEGRWFRMRDTVRAVDGKFTYSGRTYTAPRAGAFRIELLNEVRYERQSRVGIGADINRDGNPTGASRDFAVLWDPRTDDVWVDTDQNRNFTNEKMLTDFNRRPEFGVFGKDDPRTPYRETMGFGIQIDKAKDRLALNLGNAMHASGVVGAGFASRGTTGRFEGVAPGAQLYPMAVSGARYSMLESVVRAIKSPKIDAIWIEQPTVRDYGIRDGRLVTTVIWERLNAKYKKPILVPTHNYAAIMGSDDYVVGAGLMGVAGHKGKDNYMTHNGARVPSADNLYDAGGYGPMGDGANGPDILSPSDILSTSRAFRRDASNYSAGLYRLPPGYKIGAGTSTATPTAAGGVALLISAAKQSGVKYDAFRIERALTGSAQFMSHHPAYLQGAGIINVAGAWELLKAMDKVPPANVVTITSRAPVRHAFSGLLATPHEGVGLFEREGWLAGASGTRTVTFTRTSGPARPMTFALNWKGNASGTFSTPPSVTLSLNKPVQVTIGIAPKTAHAHSAHLLLDHPDVPGHAHRMLATIIAAERLDGTNNYSVQTRTEVPRPDFKFVFYTVPAGATALRVDIESRRSVGVSLVRPDTRAATAVEADGGGGGGRGGGAGGGGSAMVRSTYIVTDPMPGTWEVRLSDGAGAFDYDEADKNEPVAPTPVTLTVSAIAVEAGLSASGFALAFGEDVTAAQAWITNRMAAFNGMVTGATVGAARRDRGTVAERERKVYEIDVPAGSASLMVRVSNPSDTAADLDVYVFNCARTCSSTGQSDLDPAGDEVVTVQNPAAGKWKVVVDGMRVPAGTTSFDYLDVVVHPSYGIVNTLDSRRQHAVGETWTTPVRTWAASPLPTGRVPYLSLVVQGALSAGTTINIGAVELRNRK